MKRTNRIIALLLTALMLIVSMAAAVSAVGEYAIAPNGAEGKVNEDVTFQKFKLTSGERVVMKYTDTADNKKKLTSILVKDMEANKTKYPDAVFEDLVVNASAIEFSSADGYLPLAFMGYAGTSATLEKQVEIATNKYGYEVVGAINGSFFSMDSDGRGAYGTLVDYIISNGKVMSAHAGDACEVVAFASDGTFKVVNSNIDYKLYINGESVGSLYYVNKTSGTKKADYWGNGFYYFDTSCGRVTDTNSNVEGYNVLCKKLDNTDLIVGGTLKGEVISVTRGTEGAQVSEGYNDVSDKFDIFVKVGSPNEKYVKDLKPGDSVNISVNETVEASREIIENANSVIENVGWLVKDGVDQTQIKSTIGTHSVTYSARWTAFGRKADGSYVYFTTDSMVMDGGDYSSGSSPCATLRDVARTMIDMGCVDVIRMDGGGSTAMYSADDGSGNPGYIMVTDGYVRPIADCILIVKKSSAVNEEVNAALKALVEKAKGDESADASVTEVLDEIDAFLEKEPVPVQSDARRLLMKLQSALSGKDELNALLSKVAGVSFSDYSEEVLTNLRKAYDEAAAVFGDDSATGEQVSAATEKLAYWYALSGDVELPLSVGAKYVIDQGSVYDHPEYMAFITDDGVRLTDGKKGSTELMTPAYTAWNQCSSIKPTVTVDLGEVKEADSFKAYAGGGDWGISAPVSVLVQISEDGKAFTDAGVMTSKENGKIFAESAPWQSTEITLLLEKPVSARFVRFTVTAAGNFAWVEELEVCKSAKKVEEGVYITGFNKNILTNDCAIFTSTVGNLKENDGKVNAKWTRNVFLKYDEDSGYYVVTANSTAGGSAPDVTLGEGEILLAVHGDPGGAGYPNKQLAASFAVGSKVAFYGVDFENEKLTVAPYAKLIPDPKPAVKLGDVNGDGNIDALDYAMVKRHVLGTYTLTEDQIPAADINGDGNVDALDYAMVKRHVLGTFTIE